MQYTEFLHNVTTLPQNSKFAASDMLDNQLAEANGLKTWSGVSTYKEALNLCENGDPAKIKELKTEIANSQEEIKKAVESSIFGTRLDFDKYLQGNPECLKRTVRKRPEPRKIWLNVDFQMSYKVDGDTIKAYAARLINVINHLTAQGNIVKLTASWRNRYSKTGHIDKGHFIIKDYDDALIINDVNAIFQPYFLRRIMFKHWEQYSNLATTYGTIKESSVKGAINLPRFEKYLGKVKRESWTRTILARINKELS